MSIAQHSVAGEGMVHPCAAEGSGADAQALAQFTCDSTNLPWVIFRAAHRAAHLGGLPARARALLAALARTVDATRPYAAIYARRELLTGRAMQSMRTFYRSLADLETAGLIVRTPQRRFAEVGKFGRVYLHLTQTAAELLGLVASDDMTGVSPGSTTDAPARSSTGSTEPSSPHDSQAASLSHPYARVAHGRIQGDLYPPTYQKRQPGELPADLQRLLSLGFRKNLVFKLMREARQQGKLLSDVVAVAWEHLKQATWPIAYLRKLLKLPVDFRHQHKQRHEAQRAEHAALKRAEQVAKAVARHSGETFFDQAITRRITLSADSATMTVLTCDEAHPRIAPSGWQAAWFDALRAGQLVPATPALEHQFAEQRRARTANNATANVTSEPPRVLSVDGASQLARLRALARTLRARGPRALA